MKVGLALVMLSAGVGLGACLPSWYTDGRGFLWVHERNGEAFLLDAPLNAESMARSVHDRRGVVICYSPGVGGEIPAEAWEAIRLARDAGVRVQSAPRADCAGGLKTARSH